ncbi:ATP-binding protein, partial [uncultured Albimonas sp.]|uniref:sensor histidine kinase n=1 Tax=uncultured Albimonas sp. TaxID=1331701 RepID=UPI0030EEE195
LAAAAAAILCAMALTAGLAGPARGAGAGAAVVCILALAAAGVARARRPGPEVAASAPASLHRTIFETSGLAMWQADWSRALPMCEEAERAGRDVREWFLEHPQKVREAAAGAALSEANSAAARLFGVSDAAELLREGIGRFRTAASEAALPGIFAAIHAGAPWADAETTFRTASGGTVDVLFRVALPPDHDDWRRTLIMAMDVTPLRRAEAELRRAQDELAHHDRISMLGQLAASIAHEVNQPLAAAVSYARAGARWLARETPDIARARENLEQVESNALRAAQIVQRIRAMTRRSEAVSDLVRLGEVADETLALARRHLEAADMRVSLHAPRRLPPVRGDRIQIQQVLMNLVLNALEASRGLPAERRQIEIALAEAGDRLRLSVGDRGRGLDPETHERAFDPFFTTRAGGMGMGLAICRNIVEAHGGVIRAELRAPRPGACFVVELPAATDTAPALRQAAE